MALPVLSLPEKLFSFMNWAYFMVKYQLDYKRYKRKSDLCLLSWSPDIKVLYQEVRLSRNFSVRQSTSVPSSAKSDWSRPSSANSDWLRFLNVAALRRHVTITPVECLISASGASFGAWSKSFFFKLHFFCNCYRSEFWHVPAFFKNLKILLNEVFKNQSIEHFYLVTQDQFSTKTQRI